MRNLRIINSTKPKYSNVTLVKDNQSVLFSLSMIIFATAYLIFFSFFVHSFSYVSVTTFCRVSYDNSLCEVSFCLCAFGCTFVCACVFVRTLNNYMISRVVKTFSSYLSKPFQKVKDDFIRVLFGKHLSSLFLLFSIQ